MFDKRKILKSACAVFGMKEIEVLKKKVKKQVNIIEMLSDTNEMNFKKLVEKMENPDKEISFLLAAKVAMIKNKELLEELAK